MAVVVSMEQLSLDTAAAAAAAGAGEDNETPEALSNPACLAATFSCLDGEASLLTASAVCRLWASVLESDAIWRRVYLRCLPPPVPHERVGSYRQQFRRLRALLDPPAPEPAALKGSALCFNEATGRLVSYNARQRILSVQAPDGSIRSEVAAEAEGAAGSAHRPLLASTGSELVVLAAADGPLQLWDVASCTQQGLLGSHSSFVTSLAASGRLVASTCSSEMRLWDVDARSCLFQVPVGLPLPSPVLEPHVAVCHKQQLLALANCAAPAPSSVVKIYSTQPASRDNDPSSSSRARSSGVGGRGSGAAAAAAAVATVGSSSCPGARGALLLRELPVNAAADMKLEQGLLLVASCFHGRAVSSNSPYKSERPFTVVVHVWETRTWQLTRLISPRLWTDSPIFSMQGTPLISLSQGVLLCATLRSGATNAFPSCCVHALQLAPGLARAGEAAGSDAADAAADGSSSGSAGLTLLSASPACGGSLAAASAAQQQQQHGRPQAEPIGSGATAQGRVAVATAGGAGQAGVSASNTIMVAVSDQERQGWSGRVPLVADTGGRVTVLLTTPTALVMATEAGQVLRCSLADAIGEAPQPPSHAQQQPPRQPDNLQGGAVPPPQQQVHVQAGSGVIHLDF